MKTLKIDQSKTVLMICVGFMLIYLITKWNWSIFVALTVGLMGIFSPYLSRILVFGWTKLTWLLSLIVPNIVLGTIFYLFLYPISALSKIFGKKDPMNLKNKFNSTFIECDKEFDKSSFEKPW